MSLCCIFSIQLSAQQCIDNGNMWDQSWTSCTKKINPIDDNGLNHWIVFEFDQAESITTSHIWNANRNGESELGAKTVGIHYSLDGTNWLFYGNQTFPKATETNNYVGFAGPDFGGQFVKKILFTIIDTYGTDTCVSLAEVKFNIDDTACYGTIDECGVCDGPGQISWYQDLDGDGLGNRDVSVVSCIAPSGYVSNDDDDCDNGILDWADIGPTFISKGCTDCHGQNGQGGLDLRSYEGITNGGNKCGTDILTGNTLVNIITIDQYAGCGPAIGLPAMNSRIDEPLSTTELAAIQKWVNDGALEDCKCPNGSVDSDNDGVCDAIDFCPGFNNALIGTSCDDGIACTTNDIYDADCNCKGTITMDSDLDGICDALDQAIHNPCTADGTIDGIEPVGWIASPANDCDNDGVNIEDGDLNDYNECIDDIGALAIAECQCPNNKLQAGGTYLSDIGVPFPLAGSGLPNGTFNSAINSFDRYFLEFPHLEANEEICFVVGWSDLENKITFDLNGVAHTFLNELQDITRAPQEFCIKTIEAGPQIVMMREEGVGAVFIDGSTYNYCPCAISDPKYNTVDCLCPNNKTTGTGQNTTGVGVANVSNADGLPDGNVTGTIVGLEDSITIEYPYVAAGGEICITLGFNSALGVAETSLNGIDYQLHNASGQIGYTLQELCIPVTSSGMQTLNITESNNGTIQVDGTRSAYCNPCLAGDPDSDFDGICDANDPCPNSYTDDSDYDGICDDLDICLGFNDAFDDDGDGVPNGCDQCEGFNDAIDSDGDSVIDGCDLCPGGDDFVDSDMDNIPDACDSQPCLNFITELNYSDIIENQKAKYQILTNGSVASNNTIQYQAGQAVNLKEEFEVELGKRFEAEIVPCN